MCAIAETLSRGVTRTKEANRTARKTVLVIDDEPFIGEAMKTFLELCGFVVLNVSSGEGGLKLWAENREHIDVVVLDFFLPKMHGDEVLKRMLTLDPEVKVIIVTGSNVRLSRFVGAKRVLRKPLEPNRVLAAIESLFGS